MSSSCSCGTRVLNLGRTRSSGQLLRQVTQDLKDTLAQKPQKKKDVARHLLASGQFENTLTSYLYGMCNMLISYLLLLSSPHQEEVRHFLHGVVLSNRFELFFDVLIVANTVVMALESQYDGFDIGLHR